MSYGMGSALTNEVMCFSVANKNVNRVNSQVRAPLVEGDKTGDNLAWTEQPLHNVSESTLVIFTFHSQEKDSNFICIH